MKATTATATHTIEDTCIDIRAICRDSLGIDIQERKLTYPVVGASRDGDCYEIIVDGRLPEAQKRVVIASIIAVCWEADERVDCIMTECREKSLAKKARRLLMPKKSFRAEYDRLADLGSLRFSALAVIFNVPLDEVMCRAHDLHLA